MKRGCERAFVDNCRMTRDETLATLYRLMCYVDDANGALPEEFRWTGKPLAESVREMAQCWREAGVPS